MHNPESGEPVSRTLVAEDGGSVLQKPCRPRNTSTLPPVQTRLAGRPSSTAMVWKKLGSRNFSSCPNGSIQWIWDVLGECAQDGWDEASVGLGLISILCFAASTFPQFIKAYKTGNMDQALSLWFLLGWIGGDSCNLIGSFLADQLPLQSYTAVYYVMADLVMLTLYFYYKFRKRPSPLSAPINSMLLFLMGTACTTPLLSAAGPVAAPREGFRGRALLSVEPGSKPFTRQEIIGFIIGSVSSVLYLLSRLPQIRTNARCGLPARLQKTHVCLGGVGVQGKFLRKSTQGISYSLFALVMLGNTLYGLSVLLKNPEEGQSEGSYLLHHLPWLVGSLGVLLLDTIISIQFLVYRRSAAASELEPLLLPS
ncbi:lysosomal amino acid transporter 1 homolog isoform X1 [Macaca nemestrina]|uniref:lysosomal amino acid transporter 1 homolog isoform X1 n=2 Tax=Macaca nemestrina TaxID=9545 RepID=UPI0039B89F50